MKRSRVLLSLIGFTGCATGSVVSQPAYDPPARVWSQPGYAVPLTPTGSSRGPGPTYESSPQPMVEDAIAFYGAHPVPDAEGGGWCQIDGPHLHPYEPQWYDQFAIENGYLYFGAGQAEWGYMDGHPGPAEQGGHWCGLTGPHRHVYRPWPGYLYYPTAHAFRYDPDHSRVVNVAVVRPSPDYRMPPRVSRRVPRNVAHAPAGNAPPTASEGPTNVAHPTPPVPVLVPSPAPMRPSPERTYYPAYQPRAAAAPAPETPRPAPSVVYAPPPAPAPRPAVELPRPAPAPVFVPPTPARVERPSAPPAPVMRPAQPAVAAIRSAQPAAAAPVMRQAQPAAPVVVAQPVAAAPVARPVQSAAIAKPAQPNAPAPAAVPVRPGLMKKSFEKAD